MELYSRLEKSDRQLTYYDSGIGTFVEDPSFFTRLKQRIEHGIDMAIAMYVPHTLPLYWCAKRNAKPDI